MDRRSARPADLVAGVVCVALAVLYLVDAAGGWDVPTEVGAYLAVFGLVGAALTALVHRAVRSRRGAGPQDG